MYCSKVLGGGDSEKKSAGALSSDVLGIASPRQVKKAAPKVSKKKGGAPKFAPGSSKARAAASPNKAGAGGGGKFKGKKDRK
jgi:hypothetical protein